MNSASSAALGSSGQISVLGDLRQGRARRPDLHRLRSDLRSLRVHLRALRGDLGQRGPQPAPAWQRAARQTNSQVDPTRRRRRLHVRRHLVQDLDTQHD
ncbi:hypothetical protein FJT64_022764 [Amphibalanus amphitrite]|uniref:Uncharacterized protein n=1 Tax=Amphibalanus amphitrite TaxID=1232801 RepID=A0A6A4WD26_AMPAM|nr:hypothetical protein FJT64_022764 [Amphibalanus amphitrite]